VKLLTGADRLDASHMRTVLPSVVVSQRPSCVNCGQQHTAPAAANTFSARSRTCAAAAAVAKHDG
jgi:hypothetical protein